MYKLIEKLNINELFNLVKILEILFKKIKEDKCENLLLIHNLIEKIYAIINLKYYKNNQNELKNLGFLKTRNRVNSI